MSQTNVESKVRTIIAEHLGRSLDEVKVTSALVDDLGADSLDMVELQLVMEEEFKIELQEEEAEKLKTVADLVKFIESKRGAA